MKLHFPRLSRYGELMLAAALAVLSSVVVYWQTGRVLPLFDYSYQIENAYRIALGQVPYRDFIFILTPLTHYLLALCMKLFGFSSIAPLIYMLAVSFAVVMLTYWILVLLKTDKRIRLYLLIPLVFAAHGIIPLPSYDVTATLFILLSLGWLLRLVINRQTGVIGWLAAGVLIVMPALAKQNIGSAYLAAVYLGLFLLRVSSPKTIHWRTILTILAGSLSMVLVSGGLLAFSHALIPFIRSNRFVLTNRDPIHYGLAILYDVIFWKNLVIYTPLILAIVVMKHSHSRRLKTAVTLAAVILSFAFIPGLYCYLISQQPIYTDVYFKLRVAVRYFFSVWYVLLLLIAIAIGEKLTRLKNLNENEFLDLFVGIVLGMATAAGLLAQGVGGSTFGIYPFFSIFLAVLYRQCAVSFKQVAWSHIYAVALILTAIFLAVFVYFNIRQSYVPVAGQPRSFSSGNLPHLATPGPWAGEMDNMLRVVNATIPRNQSVVNLPGEDPFYFATGRQPVLRYFELYSGVLPYTPERVAQDIATGNIDWLIVKTHLQSPYYMDTRPILEILRHCYSPFRQIPGYSMYRKSGPCQATSDR